MVVLLADGLAPTGDPWPWICGILALANVAQWIANAKERAQNRTDLMTVVPVLTEAKTVLGEVKDMLR